MVSGAAVSTTQPAGIDPFNISNLLAGLAWLREASIDHIRRLWFPDYSVTCLRKLLRRLEADEIIDAACGPFRVHVWGHRCANQRCGR